MRGARSTATSRTMRPTRAARGRRGVMLLAVIVILAVAALAVAALNVALEAEHAGQVASSEQSQHRAGAWSGAQAVASLLAAQAGELAAGGEPELPAEVTLWEADGRTVVVRVLPIGARGERAVAEAAKLPLDRVTAEQLVTTGVVGSRAAAAVVARRAQADSAEALVDARAGLSPQAVLGPVVSSIAAAVRQAQQGREAGGEGAARPLALADVVTPFAAQRAMSVGPDGQPQPRTPLAVEWTPEAERALDGATAPGVAARVREALQDKVPADEGELVRALIEAKVEPASWSGALEVLVCDADGIERGRVDLSRAPEAVLRALPGVGAEKAARLAQEREALTADERARLAWPVERNVLTAEEFAELASHIGSHSWLWRVRFAVGTLDTLAGSESLQGVQVWEAVVDLAETPPRFASLRDITLLPVAAGLAAQMEESSEGATRREARGRSVSAPAVREGAPRPEAPSTGDLGPNQEPRSARNDAPRRSAGSREARERRRDVAVDTSRQPSREDALDEGEALAAEDASGPGVNGRSTRDARTANAPAGGLPGRWRARETR